MNSSSVGTWGSDAKVTSGVLARACQFRCPQSSLSLPEFLSTTTVHHSSQSLFCVCCCLCALHGFLPFFFPFISNLHSRHASRALWPLSALSLCLAISSLLRPPTSLLCFLIPLNVRHELGYRNPPQTLCHLHYESLLQTCYC